jgi:hypothetical protein
LQGAGSAGFFESVTRIGNDPIYLTVSPAVSAVREPSAVAQFALG